MDNSIDTIKEIVVYEGKIKLTSEFHSGTLLGEGVTDNPVIRDIDGNAVLRGESLTGLVRQELFRLLNYKCKDFTQPASTDPCSNSAVCSLMGHSWIPPDISDTESLNYHSSRLKISGGKFDNKSVRIRHGVAIDRRLNVASAHKKYDYEVLMPDTIAPFTLEIENPSEDEKSLIERLLIEMKYGFLSLGGKKGAGLGSFTLEECKKRSFDMNKKEDIIAYLLKDYSRGSEFNGFTLEESKNDFINTIKNHDENTQGFRLMIPFDIRFPELFLVNDPLEASLIGSDHVSIIDNEGNPYLPPSTIRGVLRSRAEQILRTLNPLSACDTSQEKLESYLTSCSKELENIKKKKKEEQKGSYYVPSLKELEDGTFLCMGCRLFGSTFWGSRLYFQTGKYNKDKSHKEVLQHFVAIDRFTGGGKEGAKYDALPLYDVMFADCKLIIEDFRLWKIGLLALVFKDLIQSDIRMGFGTRKGYGQAVGIFNRERDILLSTPNKAYKCRISEIYNSNGVDSDIKKFLEKAVKEFRFMVKEYKGTEYETV